MPNVARTYRLRPRNRRSHALRGRLLCGALAAIAAVFVQASLVRAEVYTFAFTGRITSLQDGLRALGPDGNSLTTFSGTYTFESDQAAEPEQNSGESLYIFRQEPAGMTVNVGNMVFRSRAERPEFFLWVRDEYGFSGADEYGFNDFDGVGTGAIGIEQKISIGEIFWNAGTYENELFGSDRSLPEAPPSVALLGGGVFLLNAICEYCTHEDPNIRIVGYLTSLTLASTPTGADLNGDGRVDRADVALLTPELGRVAAGGEPLFADLDGDGRVGLADLMRLQQQLSAEDAAVFSSALLAAEAVPEPASWVLAAALVTTLGCGLRRSAWRAKNRQLPRC